MIKFYIKEISLTESEGYLMNGGKKYGVRTVDRIDGTGEKVSAEEQVMKILYTTAVALRGLDWSSEAYDNWIETGGPQNQNKDREDSLKVYASQREPLEYKMVKEYLVFNDTFTFNDGTTLTWATRKALGIENKTYEELKEMLNK